MSLEIGVRKVRESDLDNPPPKNPSGLRPVGRAVLVKAHLPELELARSRSSIFIPYTVGEKAAIWENRVRVVAIGRQAWNDEVEPRARIGELVLCTKFAGFVKTGADGLLYRIVNDRDIFCVIEREAEENINWDEPLSTAPNRENSSKIGD